MFSGIYKWLSTILFFLIFLIPQQKIYAQSIDFDKNIGFVVYTQNIFYGFNAGSSDNELRFRFSQQNRQNVLFIDLFEEGQFFTIGAYNDKGLFILLLDHPESFFQKNRLSPQEFENKYRVLLYDSAVVPNLSSDGFSLNRWIVPNSNILLSDKSGNSLVITADETNFEFVQNEMPYSAITFLYPYSQYHEDSNILDLEPNHDYLMSEIDKIDDIFTVESGMVILKQFHPEEEIRTSVLISPSDNQVYVSMDKTTGEVWVFDINGGTVETSLGFEQNHKANIPKLGITSSDLIILNFSNENLTKGIINIAIIILMIIIIPILIFLPKLEKNSVEYEN